MAGLAERVAQPFETFIKTVTRSSASGLDVLFHASVKCGESSDMFSYPSSLTETVQAKFVGDFGSVHGVL